MLEAIVTSKTRIKLLMKFFINSATSSYLRDLEQEFGDSTNGIRLELNRFCESGMLESEVVGNKRYFKANTKHPLFKDLHNILLKYTGIDTVIESVLAKLGGLKEAWLVGDFAKGVDSKIIDLVLVGEKINLDSLLEYIEKAEPLIKRKIRYLLLKSSEKKIVDSEYPDKLLLYKEIV